MSVWGMAHRGCPTKLPENTLSSFEAACALGFSHLELDVHLSKDGIPVVMHDPTIDRMCDGKGWIKDFTLEELRRFRVRENERIPTLEEALLLAKGRTLVDVELKQTGSLYTGLEEAVLDVIRKTGMMDQVFVSSFDHYAVARMRTLDRDIRLGAVIYGCTPAIFPFLREQDITYVSVRHNFLSERFYRDCAERNIQLIAWTVDAEEDMRQLLHYPSILVCTNYPERWMAVSQQA